METSDRTISEVTLPLIDAFIRLLCIIDEPELIPVVAPLIHKEIIFYLLVSDQKPRLREIGMAEN